MKKIKVGIVIILAIISVISLGSFTSTNADPCDVNKPDVNCPG